MVTLRPVTPADAAALRAVRLRALLDAPTAFGATHAAEAALSDADWARRAAFWDGARAAAFLAVDGADVCGIAGGILREPDEVGTAGLVSVWVSPVHRRHGVGARLVAGVADWARGRGSRRLRLMVTSNNEPALRFYAGLGFTRTGRVQPYPNDAALSEYEMALELDGAGLGAGRQAVVR